MTAHVFGITHYDYAVLDHLQAPFSGERVLAALQRQGLSRSKVSASKHAISRNFLIPYVRVTVLARGSLVELSALQTWFGQRWVVKENDQGILLLEGSVLEWQIPYTQECPHTRSLFTQVQNQLGRLGF